MCCAMNLTPSKAVIMSGDRCLGIVFSLSVTKIINVEKQVRERVWLKKQTKTKTKNLTRGVWYVTHILISYVLVSGSDALEVVAAAVGAALGLGRVLAYAVAETAKGRKKRIFGS